MPIETDADRALFVDADDFGVSVAWQSAGGTVTFDAIFDDSYQLLASPLMEAGVEGSTPQLLVPASSLPADREHGDSVAIGAATYVAVEFKPDGTGFVSVRLQET